MDEKQTAKAETIRPTKKQLILLKFIEDFTGEHGYSPSYREIMAGLNYTSVATVALHVNSLIARGHLIKRGRSARSLELAEPASEHKLATNQVKPAEEKWLVEKVEYLFKQAEQAAGASDDQLDQLDQLATLVGSLKILGLDGAAHSFGARLAEIRAKLASSV